MPGCGGDEVTRDGQPEMREEAHEQVYDVRKAVRAVPLRGVQGVCCGRRGGTGRVYRWNGTKGGGTDSDASGQVHERAEPHEERVCTSVCVLPRAQVLQV